MATTPERARVANLAAVWRDQEVAKGLTKRERQAIESWARSAEIEVPATVARALARVPDLREQALADREQELARLRAEVERLRAVPPQAPAREEAAAADEPRAEIPVQDASPEGLAPEAEEEQKRTPRWLRR